MCTVQSPTQNLIRKSDTMKILGQDVSVLYNQVAALVLNVKSWFIFTYVPAWLRPQPPMLPPPGAERCVVIVGPGGMDQLQVVDLKHRATVGYNVPPFKSPFVNRDALDTCEDPTLVLVKVTHFSINYADVCIRWGLYESSLRYVGWPIVPGFDFSGVVVWAGSQSGFCKKDKVFGFSLFGAYSSQLLVPARQLRKTPGSISQAIAAGIPAVAATALHAVSLAGGWPAEIKTSCRAALIHSAAGGVGSMLIQMCKIRGYSPIVAVVGSAHKVEYCLRIGADHVIDKSIEDLWTRAELLSPGGYNAVFDANGVETLAQSLAHTALCGRLIIYGFHSNIPKAKAFIDPFEWLRVIVKMAQMPKFDPMAMVLESKTIAGFNLSFFSSEHELIAQYMEQIIAWIDQGAITLPDPQIFAMEDIHKAHELIQSGKSVGKIVVSC